MVLKSRQRNGLETGFVKKTSEEIHTSSFVWLTVRLSLDTRLRLSLRRLNSTVLQLISDWHSSLFLKRGPLISDRGRQNHFRAIDQLEWRLSVLFVQESKSAYILRSRRSGTTRPARSSSSIRNVHSHFIWRTSIRHRNWNCLFCTHNIDYLSGFGDSSVDLPFIHCYSLFLLN